MATQGTAMRNGTPMRLVSPAPMLVQPQASRQTPAAASLYSSAPQGLYGANVNTTVNGGTLSGKIFRSLSGGGENVHMSSCGSVYSWLYRVECIRMYIYVVTGDVNLLSKDPM